jgi:hypothetical protein
MWGVYDYHRGGVCGRVYVYQGGVYVYQGPIEILHQDPHNGIPTSPFPILFPLQSPFKLKSKSTLPDPIIHSCTFQFPSHPLSLYQTPDPTQQTQQTHHPTPRQTPAADDAHPAAHSYHPTAAAAVVVGVGKSQVVRPIRRSRRLALRSLIPRIHWCLKVPEER